MLGPMPDWPLDDASNRYEVNPPLAASSDGILVTGAAATNTKGAWVEIIRSTSFDAGLMMFEIRCGTTGLAGDCMYDIGVGPAGSEQVLIPNVYLSRTTTSAVIGAWQFPVSLPAGTRIAARAQSSTASNPSALTLRVMASAFQSEEPRGAIYSFGANTATTAGTPIDAGAVANTKGAWAEVVRATPSPIGAISLSVGNNKDVARVFAPFQVDIGIGAAGAEQVVIPDLVFSAEPGDDLIFPSTTWPMPVAIPAGTRIAARCRSSITGAGDRTLDVIVHGVA